MEHWLLLTKSHIFSTRHLRDCVIGLGLAGGALVPAVGGPCQAPGLMEVVMTRMDHCHGTQEVPR